MEIMDIEMPAEGYRPLVSKSRFIRDMKLTIQEKLVDRHKRFMRVLTTDAQGNSDGFLHGGFILTLADFALSYGTFDEGDRAPAITLNLSASFMRAAKPGQWLVLEIDTRKESSGLLFADCTILAEGKCIAQAAGVFRPVRPPETPAS
jgi:acyl-coenzyme A thioesterase PaaI-like protein